MSQNEPSQNGARGKARIDARNEARGKAQNDARNEARGKAQNDARNEARNEARDGQSGGTTTVIAGGSTPQPTTRTTTPGIETAMAAEKSAVVGTAAGTATAGAAPETETATETETVTAAGAERPAEKSAAASGARAARRRGLGMRGSLLGNELATMFRRSRNLVLLGALALIPVALGVALKVTTRHHGQDAGGFLAQVSNNGLFLVFSALSLTLPIFLPMALGVVAGDSISGEAAQGTLRYLLVAPAGRVRLLAVKAVSLVVFCLVSTVVVSGAALLTGFALFPVGPVTLLSGDTIGLGAALVKALWITLLVAASLLGLAALGLFVSTLTDTPIAAMAVATGVTILCGILQAIPQLSAIQPWLYTYQWSSYADLLRDPVYTTNLEHNLLIQLGYVAVFGSAAWARLTTRDVTS